MKRFIVVSGTGEILSACENLEQAKMVIGARFVFRVQDSDIRNIVQAFVYDGAFGGMWTEEDTIETLAEMAHKSLVAYLHK